MSGQVSSGLSGETIQLYTTAPGGNTPAVWLGTSVSVAGGSYSFTVTPKQTTSYVVQWQQMTSAVTTITVSPKLAFLPVVGSGFKSFMLTVDGGDPYFAGRIFLIQGFYQGHWVTLTDLRVGPAGTRVFKRPRVRNVEVYRLYLSSAQVGPSFVAGQSGTQHIITR